MTVRPRISAVWLLIPTVTITESAFRLLDKRQYPVKKKSLLLVFTYLEVIWFIQTRGVVPSTAGAAPVTDWHGKK